MGDLVFAHKSSKKFILVHLWDVRNNAAGFETFRQDHETRIRSHAQRFLALVHYLPIGDVEWVRATYTTLDHPRPHPQLFDKLREYEIRKPGHSLLVHLPIHRLEPCLTLKDVSALDKFIESSRFDRPDMSTRQSILLKEGTKDPTEVKFKQLSVNMGKPLEKECDGCRNAFPPDQLKACSGCRTVLYCSERCQKEDWPLHRISLCLHR
ncbi:hypothetical protein JCM16303_003632 [Sporobolomyces ruberrimus]